LGRPVFAYGSEAWIVRKPDEKRLSAPELRFMKRTSNCMQLDHKRNDILEN
jgi:hypothetical protein